MVQEPLIDVQALVELGASFGPVAIERACGNWQHLGRCCDALLQSAVELIQQSPPGESAKNGADITLCLDVIEDISRFVHIGTIIIVGGDSDLMPVAQKIKAAGRTLTGIGIGDRSSTNKLCAKSCEEFRYNGSLVEALSTEEATKPREARVNQVSVRHMIKRLDPTFDPKDHSHPNFAEMVDAMDAVVEVKKGDTADMLRVP